jgi:hypothetical protein
MDTGPITVDGYAFLGKHSPQPAQTEAEVGRVDAPLLEHVVNDSSCFGQEGNTSNYCLIYKFTRNSKLLIWFGPVLCSKVRVGRVDALISLEDVVTIVFEFHDLLFQLPQSNHLVPRILKLGSAQSGALALFRYVHALEELPHHPELDLDWTLVIPEHHPLLE